MKKISTRFLSLFLCLLMVFGTIAETPISVRATESIPEITVSDNTALPQAPADTEPTETDSAESGPAESNPTDIGPAEPDPADAAVSGNTTPDGSCLLL